MSDNLLGTQWSEGITAQENTKRLKWLVLVAYDLLVDWVVELQNIFHITSAKALSTINSPNCRNLPQSPEKIEISVVQGRQRKFSNPLKILT